MLPPSLLVFLVILLMLELRLNSLSKAGLDHCNTLIPWLSMAQNSVSHPPSNPLSPLPSLLALILPVM